jgi:hypothetical protein
MALKRKSSWHFFILLVVTIALSVWVSSVHAQATSTAVCPQGQGYWKNTAAWPVTELTLGSQTYSQAELLILFNTPVDRRMRCQPESGTSTDRGDAQCRQWWRSGGGERSHSPGECLAGGLSGKTAV